MNEFDLNFKDMISAKIIANERIIRKQIDLIEKLIIAILFGWINHSQMKCFNPNRLNGQGYSGVYLQFHGLSLW